MNISLTAKLEHYVRDKVKSGNYNNASEVIREALRMMIEQEDLRNTTLRGGLAERATPYQTESRSTRKNSQL